MLTSPSGSPSSSSIGRSGAVKPPAPVPPPPSPPSSSEVPQAAARTSAAHAAVILVVLVHRWVMTVPCCEVVGRGSSSVGSGDLHRVLAQPAEVHASLAARDVALGWVLLVLSDDDQ